MQTTRTPLWKSALWSIGIVAIVLVVTGLGIIAAWSLIFLRQPGFRLEHLNLSYPVITYFLLISSPWVGVLWIGLLTIAAWQLSVRRHKTAARMLAAMAGITLVVSLYIGSWLSMNRWWLGYVGVRNPPLFEVHDICDDWGNNGGCAHYHATLTAEAPHPPEWLPWGH